MTPVHVSARRDVLTDVEHAHRHARAALDGPQHDPYAAVSWASAHLAAVEHVLHPMACRVLSDGRNRVRDQRVADEALQRALWQLDRRLTGDVHHRHLVVEELEQQVLRCLDEHARIETRLLEDLLARLDDKQQADLTGRLADALLKAPTRPHPDVPHGGMLEGLVFRLSGMVDRARDSMDSRTVPTPRVTRPPRPMDRWGAYLMGAPFAGRRAVREADRARGPAADKPEVGAGR